MIGKEEFINEMRSICGVNMDYAEYVYSVYEGTHYFNETSGKRYTIDFIKTWISKSIEVNGMEAISSMGFFVGTLNNDILSKKETDELNKFITEQAMKSLL